jgi:cytochrome c oxidase subunit II
MMGWNPSQTRMRHRDCIASLVLSWVTLATASAWPGAARADAPLNYLRTHGLHADAATTLLWGMMLISLAVVVIVCILLMGAVFRRRDPPQELSGRSLVARASGGLAWIAVGVGTSIVVLFAVTVWTVVTLAAVSRPPPSQGGADIAVIGHQWWWEVRYLGADPTKTFTTANEIHIPMGQPVHVKLEGLDVIHSFWVPALAGKTDLIPGQSNTTWLQANAPGVYRGQCTEYCGQQHAHMGLQVIASAPDEFDAWRNNQLKGVSPAISPSLRDDQNAFVTKCGVCHAVRGTRAGGILGPDLSHLITRTTIAAGTLPNTPGYLAGWIADPQRIKPGSLMPQLDLPGPELARIVRFLETLN